MWPANCADGELGITMCAALTRSFSFRLKKPDVEMMKSARRRRAPAAALQNTHTTQHAWTKRRWYIW